MRRLIFQTFLFGGVKVAGAGLTFLTFMFLARVMTVEECGRFALVFSLGSLGALLALFGQHTRALKRMSASLEAQKIKTARSVFWQSCALVGMGSLLVVGALLSIAFFWSFSPLALTFGSWWARPVSFCLSHFRNLYPPTCVSLTPCFGLLSRGILFGASSSS